MNGVAKDPVDELIRHSHRGSSAPVIVSRSTTCKITQVLGQLKALPGTAMDLVLRHAPE